jgi:hypothetical protein
MVEASDLTIERTERRAVAMATRLQGATGGQGQVA